MKNLFLATVLILSSIIVSAQKDSTNTWKYTDKVDEMTNDHSYYAETSDDEAKVTATLTIKRIKNNDDVIMSVHNGILNFKVYSGIKSIIFKAKFDDTKIEKFGGYPASDGSFDTMYISPTKSFIKKLKVSKITFIEVEIYNEGTYTFKFNTKDLKWNR